MNNKFLNIIGVLAVTVAVYTAYFYTRGKTMTSGINTANMDMTVTPGDDFFDYATRGWRAVNPIPDDYSRYGAFEILHDTNMHRVREIIEKDNGKIGTLYHMIMDENRRNSEGTAPLQSYLDEISAIKTRDDLAAYMGRVHHFSGGFWSDVVALDEMDSAHFLYNIGQGGIGISRDYFFDTDAKSVQVRSEYKKFLAKMAANFGLKIDVEKIYAMEERMAKSFHPKELLRDPHANYHKMSISEIKQDFPGFDWDAYLAARGASAAQYINVGQ
ncbi:hypothetical protein HDR66_00890, partial [bacterium]|nr:hypothetical protein [bacterium]